MCLTPNPEGGRNPICSSVWAPEGSFGKAEGSLGSALPCSAPRPRRCLRRPSAAFPGAGPRELAALTEGGPTALRQSRVGSADLLPPALWDFEKRTHFRTCGIGYFYFCVVSFRTCRAFYLHESCSGRDACGWPAQGALSFGQTPHRSCRVNSPGHPL